MLISNSLAATGLLRAASTRCLSGTLRKNGSHVAVLGASGGIGQPLSLLLKKSPLISRLNLFDIANTPGVAADLSHIDTSPEVAGFLPENDGLEKALTNAEVVLIPAGVPRKPGMSRADLFNTNAQIVFDLATACAKYCPKARILVISNPVNSTVPIVSEVMKKHNVYDPARIFGVTTLDAVRASRFGAWELKKAPEEITVPVVGGHSGNTIVPLLSQSPLKEIRDEEVWKTLVKRIQFGGDEVVQAKMGSGSATLSMAYAAERFTNNVLLAMAGQPNVTETAFVRYADPKGEKPEYFAVKFELNKDGVKSFYAEDSLTKLEEQYMKDAIAQLKIDVQKGVDFVKSRQ